MRIRFPFALLLCIDMVMPGNMLESDDFSPSYFGPNLTLAVKAGKLDESRVTDMAIRITSAYFKMGQDQVFQTPTALKCVEKVHF